MDDSVKKEIVQCIILINKLQLKLIEYSCYSPAQDTGQVAARQELESQIHAIRTRMHTLQLQDTQHTNLHTYR